MKNIYSNIYKPTNNNLSKAKIAIEKGDVVAVPTETVYGLAANAYNSDAIKKIFSLKKRPSNNVRLSIDYPISSLIYVPATDVI